MRESVSDRHAVRFREEVEASFDFLLGRGFQRVQSMDTLVRFESDHAYINVYQGQKSFEISLEIGPLLGTKPATSPYSMSEIIRLIDASAAERYRDYSAHTPDDVVEGVRRLATTFRQYVDKGLLSDPKLFERLHADRERWKSDFVRDTKLAQARLRLDVAWHTKDFDAVVKILTPLRDSLTPAELTKLEYASKRVESR